MNAALNPEYHALCSCRSDIPVGDRSQGCACPITEQEKYERMWSHDEYRSVAPGEDIAALFLSTVGPKPGAEVIDFGCGTGRGALMLAMLGGLKVHMLDFAANSLDADIVPMLTTQSHVLSFQQHDLTQPVNHHARYGYCTDVLEHIPPHQVNAVLRNILKAAQHVFLQISCTDDHCGQLEGETLHLSVHDFKWWKAKLTEFDCVFHWTADHGTHCMFYVTAWSTGKDILDAGVLNVGVEQIVANVKANVAAGWMHAQHYQPNEEEVLLLAGGPSLPDHLDEIRELSSRPGSYIVTLNGSYNWAIEHGLNVRATVVVDARLFNSRFVSPVMPETKYLIASQCNPKLLEGLPKDRTYLWHTTVPEIRDALNERLDIWYGVTGGSTVTLRAIPLLRMMGFRHFKVFGWDSCLMNGQSHAYAQPENDDDYVIPVTIGDKVFQCTVWQASQAYEFMDLIRYCGDLFELEIYGDGLLAEILKTGAEAFDLEEMKRLASQPDTD